MSSEPLKPFTPPEFLSNLSSNSLVTGFFSLVLIYWILYTVVAVHHWLTYSHNANIALPAIAVHLFVSIVLIGYVVTGLL